MPVSLRGDGATRRGGRAHISRTLQLPQHVEVAFLGCDVHRVGSIVLSGMDVDFPALQLPQHVEVASLSCPVHGVGSMVVGGIDVDFPASMRRAACGACHFSLVASTTLLGRSQLVRSQSASLWTCRSGVRLSDLLPAIFPALADGGWQRKHVVFEGADGCESGGAASG